MFSEPQHSSSELQQYDYFVMQEPVFEPEIEEPVYPQVYEENGVLFCASSTSEGVYWYTYCLNNPLIYTDPDGEWALPIFILGAGLMKVLFDMPSKGHADYGDYTFKDGAQSFAEGAFMAGAMVAAPGSGGPLGIMSMMMPMWTGNFQMGPFSYNMTNDQWALGWGPVDYNMTSNELDYMFEDGNTLGQNVQYGLRMVSDVWSLYNSGRNAYYSIQEARTTTALQNELYHFADYKYPPELMFDGEQIHIVNPEGAVVYSTNAYSGHKLADGTFDYSIQRQKFEWNGPIPEGGYTIKIDEIQRIGIGNRIKSVFGGEWPGGTASWGRQRVWINPMIGTNTYGRGNFTIHGGKIPGSGGCIDLVGNVNVFFRQLRRSSSGFNIIPLRVNY